MRTEQRELEQGDRPAHKTSVGEKVGDIDPAYDVARIRRDDTTQDPVQTTIGKFTERKGSFRQS